MEQLQRSYYNNEVVFIKHLIFNNPSHPNIHRAKAYSSTKRYIDDLLLWGVPPPTSQDYGGLDHQQHSLSTNSVTFLGAKFTKQQNGSILISVFDKTEEWNFPVIRYPHATSNKPDHQITGVVFSQLVRYRNICTTIKAFKEATTSLVKKFLERGHNRKIIILGWQTYLRKFKKDKTNLLSLRAWFKKMFKWASHQNKDVFKQVDFIQSLHYFTDNFNIQQPPIDQPTHAIEYESEPTQQSSTEVPNSDQDVNAVLQYVNNLETLTKSSKRSRSGFLSGVDEDESNISKRPNNLISQSDISNMDTEENSSSVSAPSPDKILTQDYRSSDTVPLGLEPIIVKLIKYYGQDPNIIPPSISPIINKISYKIFKATSKHPYTKHKCPICTRLFSSKLGLTTHQTDHHKSSCLLTAHLRYYMMSKLNLSYNFHPSIQQLSVQQLEEFLINEANQIGED